MLEGNIVWLTKPRFLTGAGFFYFKTVGTTGLTPIFMRHHDENNEYM